MSAAPPFQAFSALPPRTPRRFGVGAFWERAFLAFVTAPSFASSFILLATIARQRHRGCLGALFA